jgi:hypothetical protein
LKQAAIEGIVLQRALAHDEPHGTEEQRHHGQDDKRDEINSNAGGPETEQVPQDGSAMLTGLTRPTRSIEVSRIDGRGSPADAVVQHVGVSSRRRILAQHSMNQP